MTLTRLPFSVARGQPDRHAERPVSTGLYGLEGLHVRSVPGNAGALTVLKFLARCSARTRGRSSQRVSLRVTSRWQNLQTAADGRQSRKIASGSKAQNQSQFAMHSKHTQTVET